MLNKTSWGLTALLFMVWPALAGVGSVDNSFNLPKAISAAEIKNGSLNHYRIGDPPPGNDNYPLLYAQPRYPVKTFGVISGYRTPFYNKKIGNVANSRHTYGDAMDFFIDADGDGRMDDLNKDGRHNKQDVDLLYQIVDSFKRRSGNAHLVGGVGRYYKTSNHGGFIHVDTRGYRARW